MLGSNTPRTEPCQKEVNAVGAIQDNVIVSLDGSLRMSVFAVCFAYCKHTHTVSRVHTHAEIVFMSQLTTYESLRALAA